MGNSVKKEKEKVETQTVDAGFPQRISKQPKKGEGYDWVIAVSCMVELKTIEIEIQRNIHIGRLHKKVHIDCFSSRPRFGQLYFDHP